MRRLAPFALVIGAGMFGFVVGVRLTARAAIGAAEAVIEEYAEQQRKNNPLAYLVAMAEEFGDLTTEPSTERLNCGYCGVKAPHAPDPRHGPDCPYLDTTLGPTSDEVCDHDTSHSHLR